MMMRKQSFKNNASIKTYNDISKKIWPVLINGHRLSYDHLKCVKKLFFMLWIVYEFKVMINRCNGMEGRVL